MSDLTEFVLSRIAEDEALLNAAPPVDRVMTANRIAVMPIDGGWEVTLDIERVRAECQAKRYIVVHCAAMLGDAPRMASELDASLDWALRCAALPYSDHADYRDEWRP